MRPGAVAAVEEGEALEVLPPGQVGVERGLSMKPATPSRTPTPASCPGPAEDPDGAGVGPDQAEQHPQQRGLAGPVGAEHAVDLAGGDAQGDVVDGDAGRRRSW